MNALRVYWSPASLVLLVLVGWQASSNPAEDRVSDVAGRVVAVDPRKNTVTLDHEDIPGLMKAMGMSFSVDDARVLAEIKPGDAV